MPDVTCHSTNTVSQNWQFTVLGVQLSFSYDANGNTLTDGQRTFTWDAKNRLKTVTKSGTTYEWDYDYQDRRVREYQYAAGGSKPTIPTSATASGMTWTLLESIWAKGASSILRHRALPRW